MYRVATMNALSVLQGNYEQEWSKSMVHHELQGVLLEAINNQEMEERRIEGFEEFLETKAVSGWNSIS